MEQLKYLLSHRNLSEGEIFALLINLGLEKYDPRKKKVREEKTQTQIQSPQNQSITHSGVKKSQDISDKKTQSKKAQLSIRISSQKNRNKKTPDTSKTKFQYVFEKTEIKERSKNQRKTQSTHPIKKISRYIPAKIRKQVWLRDEGRCTYSCPQTKRQCHSQNFLQIDHIQPYALGGNHEIKNLRLLCANHNQYRK